MLVAEYVVSSTILHNTMRANPAAELSHEAQYWTQSGKIRFFFWMSGVKHDPFETAVAVDPTVTNLHWLDTVESQHLYRVDFTAVGRNMSTFPMWADDDAILLDAQATEGEWRIRMRLPDRATLSKYRDTYINHDCSFALLALYQETAGSDLLEASLSSSQREVLLTAYEAGYFEIPRQISQRELGSQLGMASQSVSEQLRRAIVALIESTLERQ
ncbi:bacterio-opsin activator [Natronolimnobius baerhuensis]|uniref:Bacterio-opsin activator n=2 Tax=Natronolimnobius baerhuensis TaxID=253108 RepID=A0A202E7H0_9EURY|nr:bacterio-opsin activator [Natronolimnobius baerhuensis]